MKINVKRPVQGYLFDDIDTGEVFYSEANPEKFLLRTDHDVWVAVDLESGILFHDEDFDHNNAQYHIVQAEVNIS